jgi:hypothetical protein
MSVSQKLEQRSVIEFLKINDLKLDDTVMKLSSLCGHNAYAKTSIKHWFQQLRLGRMDLRFLFSVSARYEFVEYQAFHLVPLFCPFLF